MSRTDARRDRDALVASGYPLIEFLAVELAASGLPPGINLDDLTSVGNEALMEAAAGHDAATGAAFKTYARKIIRFRMLTAITKARNEANRMSPLDLTTADGGSAPRADPRAEDPADLAAGRERVPARRGVATPARVAGELLDPLDVARHVLELRAVMYGAIRAADVEVMMWELIDRAKAGDKGSLKIVIDMLAAKGRE